jgi:hypothetical protein
MGKALDAEVLAGLFPASKTEPTQTGTRLDLLFFGRVK